MPKLGWEMGDTDSSAKDSGAGWLRRRTAVLLAGVAATSVHMVASGGPLAVMAPSPAGYLVLVLRLASVA